LYEETIQPPTQGDDDACFARKGSVGTRTSRDKTQERLHKELGASNYNVDGFAKMFGTEHGDLRDGLPFRAYCLSYFISQSTEEALKPGGGVAVGGVGSCMIGAARVCVGQERWT